MRLRPWFYNTLYRFNIAPWDKEVRPQLVELVSAGRLTPTESPRVLDLGCGTGAEAVYLASEGFGPVLGVDFSAVALRRARARAEAAGVTDRCSFIQADITAGPIAGAADAYDLVLDFGALDDTVGEQRLAFAAAIRRLCRPGGKAMVFCYQADKSELPKGTRLPPSIAPGEEKELFAEAFEIEYLPSQPYTTTLLMTRRQ